MHVWGFPGVEAEGQVEDRLPPGFGRSGNAQAASPPSAAGTPPLLEIRQLSHWFQDPRQRSRLQGPPVLDRINLHVDPGEIVVLLGPSGCGKSTLLNLASGLNQRQQGAVSLEGEEIIGPDSRLGLVFQQPALLPWLTVHGNIEFGLTLRHSERLSASQRNERIQQTLQLVGLKIHSETSPAHLSGGMAQRVALARVLLLRITNQTGAGMLIVTHDVDEAIQLGDRILLMRAEPGSIECEWSGRREANEQERNVLRRAILQQMGDLLQSRSP
jgi:ABC-type nitrate/sulfonate/bicarbonate transport system ATPase subunit